MPSVVSLSCLPCHEHFGVFPSSPCCPSYCCTHWCGGGGLKHSSDTGAVGSVVPMDLRKSIPVLCFNLGLQSSQWVGWAICPSLLDMTILAFQLLPWGVLLGCRLPSRREQLTHGLLSSLETPWRRHLGVKYMEMLLGGCMWAVVKTPLCPWLGGES